MAKAEATPKHLWIIGIITLLWNMMGATGLVFTVVIFCVALGLLLYSRAMRMRGVLT
jgi:hypothetical protein